MISLLSPSLVQRLQPAPAASQPGPAGTAAAAKPISLVSQGVSFPHECFELHCFPSRDNAQQACEDPLTADVQPGPAQAFLPLRQYQHRHGSRGPVRLPSVRPEQHSSNHAEDSEQRKPLSFSPLRANQTSRRSFRPKRANPSRSNGAGTTATLLPHRRRTPVSAPLCVSKSRLSHQPDPEPSGFPQLRPAFPPCHPTHQCHGAAQKCTVHVSVVEVSPCKRCQFRRDTYKTARSGPGLSFSGLLNNPVY